MSQHPLLLVAVELIALHTVDGRVVQVNPHFVTQLIAPPPGGYRQITNKVKCVIRLTDGSVVTVVESCRQVAFYFQPPKPKIVHEPSRGHPESSENGSTGSGTGNTGSSGPSGPAGSAGPAGSGAPGNGGGSGGSGPPSGGDHNNGHGNDAGHHDSGNPGKGGGQGQGGGKGRNK